MRFFCSRKSMLRLRVVANSDTPDDQAVKLRVRDAALPVVRRAPGALYAILAAAKAVDPTAKIRRGRLCFGGYASEAIEITLGAGEGRNWWGIVYPEAVGLPPEQVEFTSWIVMLLKSWGWIA